MSDTQEEPHHESVLEKVEHAAEEMVEKVEEATHMVVDEAEVALHLKPEEDPSRPLTEAEEVEVTAHHTDDMQHAGEDDVPAKEEPEEA